jgi:hypothetical protein
MGLGPLLLDLHEGIIDAAHQQVSYGVISLLIAVHSTVHGPFPDCGMVGSAALLEIVSQATKNLGYLTVSSAELRVRAARWGGKWNKRPITRIQWQGCRIRQPPSRGLCRSDWGLGLATGAASSRLNEESRKS